jgi:O-antigen/teichoic acid export membrane protein
LVAQLKMLGVLAALAWHFQGGAAEHRSVVFLILSLVGVTVWLLWLTSEARGIGVRWQSPDRHTLRQAARFAVPLIPGFLIGYLSEWGDYFLIRYFYSETEVGFFHPAYQYLLIMIGLPTALASVILPKLVAASDHDGGSSLRRLLERHAAQFGVLWGLCALLVSAVLPALFAWLVGGDYAVSVSLLQAMAIAIPGAVFQHVYGAAYFVQGRLGVANVLFFGIKIALNLVLSFWLLPRVGVLGSAIGCGVSYLALQWLFVLDQHRVLKIRFGNAEWSLLFVQLAGVILFFANDLAVRLLVASLEVASLLLWARSAGLFSPAEVDWAIPRRLGRLARPLRRLLCRRV